MRHLVEQYYNPYGIKVRKRLNAEYNIPKCEETRFTSPIVFGRWEEGRKNILMRLNNVFCFQSVQKTIKTFDWLSDIEKELLTAAFNEKTFRERYGLTLLDECFEKAHLQSRQFREEE